MFLAPGIINTHSIQTNYVDKNVLSLPWSFIEKLPVQQSGIAKDVVNPQSAYHEWLSKYGKTIDRREIMKYYLDPNFSDGNKPLTNIDAVIEKEKNKTTKDHASDCTVNANTAGDLKKEEDENDADEKITVRSTHTKHVVKITRNQVPGRGKDSETDTDDEKEVEVEEEWDHKDLSDESQDEDTSLYNAAVQAAQAAQATQVSSDSKLNAESQRAAVFRTMAFWHDKDEQVMTLRSLKHIPAATLGATFTTMKAMADELNISLSAATGALDSLTEEEKYNFLFHVIAKGEQFYFTAITDPDFCMYLLDQYQPLYTFMKQILRI